MMNLTKGYLPVLTVVSALVFVVWVTRVVVEDKLATDYKFNETNRVVKSLAEATKELAASIASKSHSDWSQDDMHFWCVQQKSTFPALQCPLRASPSYGGVLDSAVPPDKSVKTLEGLSNDDAIQPKDKK